MGAALRFAAISFGTGDSTQRGGNTGFPSAMVEEGEAPCPGQDVGGGGRRGILLVQNEGHVVLVSKCFLSFFFCYVPINSFKSFI